LSQTALAHLLAGCQSGDAEAIADLVQRYRPALFRLALSILDDPAEADEAAQEAFVAALGALDRYRGEAAFTTWLYAITVNVCRGRLRRRGARQRLRRALEALLRLSPGHAPRPEEQVMQSEAQAVVWRAIQALPQPQRLAVVLRYYHDLRLGEIASVLGVTERTVHNRLRAAHARLRGQLEPGQRE
jgi:RNA polymerase sigma-70 factor (ECF subfamily)